MLNKSMVRIKVNCSPIDRTRISGGAAVIPSLTALASTRKRINDQASMAALRALHQHQHRRSSQRNNQHSSGYDTVCCCLGRDNFG
jgi:hypothetical protein